MVNSSRNFFAETSAEGEIPLAHVHKTPAPDLKSLAVAR